MRYDLAIAVNYYSPYVSGLTETARTVAEALAERDWRVAVVATRHDADLPRRETRNGVEVFRCPTVANIGRGPVSPSFPAVAARVGQMSSVVNLHLPMLEAALIARLVRPTPVVSTFHIDLWLPPSLVNSAATRAANWSARSALRKSDEVVVNSVDQAEHSVLAATLLSKPLHPIPAPCLDRRGGEPAYRDGDGLHAGFLGRIVEDKGLRYLIEAFASFPDPKARLLIGGDFETVAGGSNVAGLRAMAGADPRIRFLGLLRGKQINDFYASTDVFCLPSVAESFGIAQVEAMMTGVPSVTTDIPGGRYPVAATGFGRLVPPRDSQALAAAILEVAKVPPAERERQAQEARDLFGVDACVSHYASVLRSVTSKSLGRPRERAGSASAR